MPFDAIENRFIIPKYYESGRLLFKNTGEKNSNDGVLVKNGTVQYHFVSFGRHPNAIIFRILGVLDKREA